MATVSVGEALGAGFRVVRGHPVAVLWWAGFYLLATGVPYILLVGPVLPDLIGAYQSAAGGDTSEIIAMQSRMMGVQPLLWLASLVVSAVLISAMFRAVTAPQDSRFGYLRFGRAELWVGITYLAMVVFAILLVIALCLPVGIVSIFAASMGGGIGRLLVLLLALGACAVLVWILLRLSMALPMAFAEERFVLFRSWDFTKGHAGKLLLMSLALIGILILIELTLATIGFAVLFGVAGNWDTVLAEAPDRLLAQLAPALVIAALVGSVIVMAVHAVMVAPWISVYRQLTVDDVAV